MSLARVWRAVTPVGRSAAGVAVVGWLAGSLTGWVELRLVAVCAAALLAAAALFTVGRSAYAVRVRLLAPRVVVGEEALGEVLVRSTAVRRLLPARMALPVGDAEVRFALPALGPGQQHEEEFVIPTARRGVVTVGPARSVRGDPLGLLSREVRWTSPQLVHVHPLTVPVAGSTAGLLRDLEGSATPVLTSSDMSFHALRGYVPGDDRRHVHWRTTARTGSLMVRQYEETRRSHLAVVLDEASGAYEDDEAFELAVSVAGSLAVTALRDQQRVTLMTSGRVLATRSVTSALDDLAAVQRSPGRTSVINPSILGRHVQRHAAGASAVALVTGPLVDAAQLHGAARALDEGVAILAVRVLPGTGPVSRIVGRTTVASLGALGDLPALTRLARRP